MSSLKHRILYADQEWRQQRLIVGFLLIGGIVFGFQGITSANKAGLIWLAYIPLGLLWGGFYLYRRQRFAVAAEEDGVHVGKTFSTQVIPYDAIRTVRVLPLRQLLPEPAGGKKRYLPPAVKANLDTPSLVLRFQGEPEQIALLTKTLGARLVLDGSAVFPVKDADAAAKEISRHLPEGSGSNLGGARRRGKRRR